MSEKVGVFLVLASECICAGWQPCILLLLASKCVILPGFSEFSVVYDIPSYVLEIMLCTVQCTVLAV